MLVSLLREGNLEGLNVTDVGAAEGCDLLILLEAKIKRSQPSAVPTQHRQNRGQK
jgi:hypothetical protein